MTQALYAHMNNKIIKKKEKNRKKNFPLEFLGSHNFPLQWTPTSLSDLTGTLGLRLAYFPVTNNVVSLGEGESSPRGEGQLYIPSWLLFSRLTGCFVFLCYLIFPFW
jgi:hypothetical protein